MAAKRAVLALALAAAAATANAAPEISIHARTQLSFDGVRRTYSGQMVATGTLRDRMTGAGLENQRITMQINGQSFEAITGHDGTFTIELPAAAGKQDLTLGFGGSDELDAADLAVQGVEVDKQPVTLALTATAINGGVQVALAATSNDNPISVRATIKTGPAETPIAKLPVVGQLTSGGTMNVTRAQAGGAGRRRIHAEFAGDPVFAAATADLTFEVKTSTKTTFTLDARNVANEDHVTGKGKVVDEDGAGVARAPVTLISGDRRLEQSSTRTDGSFRFSFEAKLLAPGAHTLQAVVDTVSPFLTPSQSDPVVVIIATPQPVPIAFTAAAFAATALVAGGFFLARSRPWDRKRRQPPPAERPAAADDRGEVKGGLVQAKPSLVSTLRRATDLGVSGTVRDAVRGRPVAGATVRIRLGSGGQVTAEHTVVSGEDGSFALENLAIGEWRAKVVARGHVTERFTLSLPHRGELRGVRVDLVPVREQVFSLYRVVAAPSLPEARLWGVWSPRQIVDHVRRQRPSPALAELTDFVEEAYFSARLPDEDVLPTAQDHVDRAVQERAARNAAV